MKELRRLIRAIQGALTPDLLNPKWRAKVKPDDHPTAGHCYIAAEALFHVWGKKRGFKPHVISGRGWTHWYLSDGRIEADPTAEQWKDKSIPYHRGKGTGFLTKRPSKRARVIIRRIKQSGAFA